MSYTTTKPVSIEEKLHQYNTAIDKLNTYMQQNLVTPINGELEELETKRKKCTKKNS